jgi:transposase
VVGLVSVHPGQAPKKLTPQFRAKVLAKTQQAPPDGSTHWSLRKMAAVMGVGKDLIRQVWQEAELKPHRLDRYMASNDPHFEEKAAEVIGLYLNPPQHAAIFCVDEKSAIQALDRLDRRLPLSPGRAERHGFEYHRHGTLSLYAALNPQTGEVIGQTASRHTSTEFVAFLGEVVASQPEDQEIHIILDNLSAHKTPLVSEFLEEHKNVKLHFTPTYSSWLNQVEIWFSRLERDVITRGIFTSVSDLRRKIMRYIRLYGKTAKPFRWKYADPTRRIKILVKMSPRQATS